MVKNAVITSFLSKTKDRFHEYNEAKSLEEKFDMIRSIEGADGVEIVYPYEVLDAETTLRLLKERDIKVAAVNANVKAEPEFRDGGLTSDSKEARAKAISYMKEAKDYAEKIGADKVTCCPLSDGYEFAFQTDYALAWKRLIESFGEAAEYKKNIPLFIEYKPSETRGTCFLNNAAKTLLLIKDMGVKEVGVTLDFGHSVYGGNNPAEELVLLAESGQPYYIHINDNDGKWDWDYFCGTKHLLEYTEFLYYLKKYGYRDYLTSDTSPTRWNVTGTFEVNARITRKIWQLLDEAENNGLGKLIGGADYLKTWKFVEENIFSLK
ncbi:sugar phosphate isomerase/epimerase [Treponema sp. OttesenSCG-928-L16]|nr:sugar phosphate isomerase/epimerase [Treponema sp. OttesenSCG-928-L16]